MKGPDISRRDFVITTAGAVLPLRTSVARPRRAVSAADLIDRLRANVGVPWRTPTTDGLKAGDPTTAVTGVTTAVVATMDVLRRTAAAGRNFVVTLEPTFYSASDAPDARANDPIYLAKRAFVDEHRIVICRFGDHWRARTPDDRAAALAAAMGWQTRAADEIYRIPETTLDALAADVRVRLGLRGGLRMVGRPDLRVRAVFVSPGTTDVPSTIATLATADVVVSGEPREWEAVPYTLDTWSAGRPKGMIAIGRIASEGPGMQACATWIRSFVPEVPVEAIPVIDPYWSPAS